MVRRALILSALFALAGCHASLTERMDVHANGTTTVHLKVVADDQLYKLAEARRGSAPSLFDASAKDDPTWNVTRTTDDDDDHLIEMTKTVKTSDVPSVLHGLMKDAETTSLGNMPVDVNANGFRFTPTITETPGLFTDRWRIHADVPSPMGSQGNPWAGVAQAMVSSFVQFRYELALPGKLISTNGEVRPDGSVLWRLPLEQTSTIDLVAETSDIAHIVAAIAGGILLIAGTTVVIRLNSRKNLRA